MDKLSIYDLIYHTICKIPDEFNVVGCKKYLYDYFVFLQNYGWTSKEIIGILDNCNSLINNRGCLDITMPFFNKTTQGLNLLKNEFYFHKELKILPTAGTVFYDYNSGTMTKQENEFYLEMRYDYTIDDLLNYVLSKDSFDKTLRINKNKTIGGLKWLLKKYDLQMILYMIDSADSKIKFSNYNKLRNIIDVQEYYDEAQQTYYAAYSNMKVQYEFRVTPKKRYKPNSTVPV